MFYDVNIACYQQWARGEGRIERGRENDWMMGGGGSVGQREKLSKELAISEFTIGEFAMGEFARGEFAMGEWGNG